MSAHLSFSLFWFFYFAGFGIHFPYFSLYLNENAALTGTQAGFVLATWPLVAIVVQPLWGQLADRTGQRSLVLAMLTLVTSLAFYLMQFVHGFTSLVAATAMLASFAAPVLPVSFSISFAAFRDAGPHAFGRARVWGTVSFLILVVAFPWLLHRYQESAGLAAVPGGPSEPGLEIMFASTAALTAIAGIIAFLLPRGGAVGWRALRGDWRHLLRHAPMWRLLAFTLLAYGFVQGPMVFFPVYVRSLGGSIDTIGQLWILMLITEIPLVLMSGTGVARFGARGLLGIGLIASGLRWVTCGLTSEPLLVYPVQLLHGVTVTGLMLGAPLYLDAIVPERVRSTGQTFLTMVGVGVGGIASTTACGWLIDAHGASSPYLVGGIGALLLGMSAWWMLPPPRRLEVEREG